MSREHGRKGESERAEAKRILATASDIELESILRRTDVRIDVRGPYPVIFQGMRSRKVNGNYAEALKIAAAIALGLDKLE